MSTENIKPLNLDEVQVSPSAGFGRRDILLKGINKGAIVVSVAAPIQTLAGQSLLTFDGKHQCSISGMQSGVHSATPTNSQICGGYSPGWWGQSTRYGKPKHWPAYVNYAASVTSVFQYSKLQNPNGTEPTLFQVMDPRNHGAQFSNTDEFHWICAWLNALVNRFNFPYLAAEVLEFYNQGPASKTYQDALVFFKTYMETHLS